ncbi:MAG: hypothetical protein QOE11_2512 [Solirubrobacteraceae bacterium]|jgi:hypothetical protein|nr:hypothetical protein [Solirubrobacteraceae bacterium]
MPRTPSRLLTVLLALPGLAGCGGSPGATAPAATTATRAVLPALATRPPVKGEIVVRGDLTPDTQGPYSFRGRYLVRFEQYAPEDAGLDFGAQTAFSATLTPRRDDPRGAIRLVQGAAAAGRRTLELRGRYFVSADFGDFPFVLRFTPRA